MTVQRTFVCSSVFQRSDSAQRMAVFIAPAKDIVKWAGVRRVGEHEFGMQRMRKPTRVSAIRRFMEAESKNVMPTGVVLAFAPGVVQISDLNTEAISELMGVDSTNRLAPKIGWAKLSFEFSEDVEEWERPALIVDGQHRLHGLALLNEDMPVLVTALIDASPVEQAFQFIVINNKATKVAVDNVKSIIAEFDEDALSRRLQQTRINYKKIPGTLADLDSRPDSPFFGLIDWASNTTGRKLVKPSAIEACIRYIKAVFPILSESDDDTVHDILLGSWDAVKSTYPNLFPDNERFMTKANLTAVNEWILDRLGSAVQDGGADIYDPESVKRYVSRKVMADIPGDFWLRAWTLELNDSPVVRNKIKEAMRRIAQNLRLSRDRDWSEGIDFVGD